MSNSRELVTENRSRNQIENPDVGLQAKRMTSVWHSPYQCSYLFAVVLFRQSVWHEVVLSVCPLSLSRRRVLRSRLFRPVAHGRFTFSGTSGGRIPGGIPGTRVRTDRP